MYIDVGMVETTKFGNLEAYTYLLVTLNLTLALIVMFFNCLCCKKRIPKNDLLGLEGMVKLKNPDEVIVVSSNNSNANTNAATTSNSLVHNSESQAELNASTVSNADSEKRSSTAAHRSLPDIPVAENNDNGSELYETVADKQLANAHNQSPQPSLKKQTSVSQHSSISQADDVSSPYSRVKGLPHDYAKVRGTEHPYAQLNAPSTSTSAVAATNASNSSSKAACSQHGTDSLQRGSQLSGESTQHLNDESTSQVEIPAASAIAGMISASQDLPYMTPPIANQHFSGDSQDSSKGYTSISVREPLANILAQQPPSKQTARKTTLTRDVNDSHYATVSDDSDETYAAIEDPNNRHVPNATDIYTSGSETYAQIQPMQANPIVVAVEINNSSSLSAASAATASSGQLPPLNHSTGSGSTHRVSSSSMEHAGPVPPHVDSLRAQMHSRQASSSSSVCNLGSPKPEKRQANSPLPPTPKASLSQSQGQHHLHSAASSSNLTSGRSSVISVIEAGGEGNNDANDASNASPQRKHSKSLSPSKDVEGSRNIEGMYAKVMKKHKFSSHQPEVLGVSPLDSAAAALLMDPLKLTTSGSDKSRVRSNSYTAKDHGYETIPADGQKQTQNQLPHENRKSDCYANILQKERQLEAAAVSQTHHNNINSSSSVQVKPIAPSTSTKHYETINCPPCQPSNSNDPGYEQLQTAPNDDDAKKSDYDPNYEVLKSRAHSDDGYAKVLEKKRPPGDVVDSSGGYSTIPGADANHNYASILETKAHLAPAPNETDHYARIAENVALTSPLTPNSSPMANSLSMITVTTSTSMVSSMSSQQTPSSSQYESLTGTGSETDPNYESVCYLNATTMTTTTTTSTNNSSNNSSSSNNTDNGYERLESDNNTQASSPLSTPSEQQLVVDDYFQV
ncbi:serine-rich adhesin for platelets isoform X2 [Drosophila montana]|uniref:serine-rich adhesin for platelets isoform X2 n=1 Tax=Drosophila montana TaxID=40370 RepID=UPI00313BBC29